MLEALVTRVSSALGVAASLGERLLSCIPPASPGSMAEPSRRWEALSKAVGRRVPLAQTNLRPSEDKQNVTGTPLPGRASRWVRRW